MKTWQSFHLTLLIAPMIIGVISDSGTAQPLVSSSIQSPDPSSALFSGQSPNAPLLDQPGVRLKPGDRVTLTVAGFPDLSGEHVIMSDGTIQLPLAGAIGLEGLSSAQANAAITEALRPYVRRPQVALSILSYSPLRISMRGEILRPGPRILSSEETQAAPITLSDALVLAGGTTPNADLRNIVVRRAASAGEAAPKTEIRINLWQTIQQGELTADVPIYDGDEIYVPSAPMDQADQQLLLASTLAPDEITVQVAGEVHRPGQVEIAPTAGISEAVAAAGGPTDKADQDALRLFRLSETGQLEQQTFEFGEASAPLRNGDLIVVEKSASDGILDTVGQLFPILNPLFWLLR
jgi:polysaccharide biosynthesis/export protein